LPCRSAVRPGIDRAKVLGCLNELPGFVEVYDLHIWGLGTTESALTTHLVCADGTGRETLLPEVCIALRRRFGIGDTLIQVETTEIARLCALRPERVV
jgi:cobalt-zinc-cadmium efflux system protein